MKSWTSLPCSDNTETLCTISELLYVLNFLPSNCSSKKWNIHANDIRKQCRYCYKGRVVRNDGERTDHFPFFGRSLLLLPLSLLLLQSGFAASTHPLQTRRTTAVRNDQLLVKSAVLNCGKFGHRRMNGCGAGVGIPVAFPGTVIVTTVYHAMKKKGQVVITKSWVAVEKKSQIRSIMITNVMNKAIPPSS